ncbi:MAG: M64 family metallopeptidase [Bacteroides sp.]
MIKQKLLLLLFVAVALLTGCSDDNATIDLVPPGTNGEVSTSINLAETNGSAVRIMFQSSHDWEAKVTLSDGSECDWLKLSPASGSAGKNTVTITTKSDNLTGDVRKAILTLYGNGHPLVNLNVEQDIKKYIALSETNFSVSKDGGTVEVLVTGYGGDAKLYAKPDIYSYGYLNMQWAKVTKGLLQAKLQITLDANQYPEDRKASIICFFLDDNDQLMAESEYIEVKQPGQGTLTSTDMSSDGEVKKLQSHTKGNVGIPIVIMGDGFIDKQIASGYYDECMQIGLDNFFSEEPFKSLREYFDVWQVTTVSETNIMDGEHNTAVNSYPTGEGTKIVGDHQKVFGYGSNISELMESGLFPETTFLVMMNTATYAGTCYYGFGNASGVVNLAVGYAPLIFSPKNMYCRVVAVHESCGHGFAKLNDEYSYEKMGAAPEDAIEDVKTIQELGWFANVSTTSDPELVPWAHFLKDERYKNGDGNGFQLTVLEGAGTYTKNLWRPTEDSMMRNNIYGFNAPSREAIYKRVMSLAYGSPWEYDYEEFVKFDQAHLPVNSASTRTPLRDDEQQDFFDKEEMRKLPRLHSPIFTGERIPF